MRLLLILILVSIPVIWLGVRFAPSGSAPAEPAPETRTEPARAMGEPSQPETTDDEVPGSLAAELAPDAQPTPEAPDDTDTPAQEATRAAAQTMPGPPLLPSPQYPDTIPPEIAGNTDQADDGNAPVSEAGQRRVTGSRVNLRAGAGTNHAVVGAVSRDQLVTPLGDEVGGWLQIQTADGQQGYLSTQFLSAPLP